MIDWLFSVVLFEMVTGGGGRVYALGPVTLRIVLFFGSVLIGLLSILLPQRRDGQDLALIICWLFVISVIPAVLVSSEKGVPFSAIAADLEPLLFWFSAPFFAASINRVRSVGVASKLLMYGGSFVGLVLLLAYSTLYLGFASFMGIYEWGARNGELFFRSTENFFFKGHFYVGVAIIFLVLLRPKFWLFICAILGLAIAASLTRGLALATIITVFFAMLDARRHKTTSLLVVAILAAGVLYFPEISAFIKGDATRTISNSVRAADIRAFYDGLTLPKFIFGSGLGVYLNGRASVEISLLWAVWKLGIFGFLFYLFPICVGYVYFGRIDRAHSLRPMAAAFFFGLVFCQLLSLTNPFINNSIGIMYSLVAVFSIRRISVSSIPSKPREALVYAQVSY